MRLRNWFNGLIKLRPRIKKTAAQHRGPAVHTIILDGTMSSLQPGHETNAGKAFKLLREGGQRANLTVYYEAGIQWHDWSGTMDVTMGKGINRQIERAYGVLASRYRPGDKIVLIGYSRGAYAVRSLAGVIGMVGLLKAEHATTRNVRQAYRHYRSGARGGVAADFRKLFCYNHTVIDAIGVWDTVKALGLRLPILWRWAEAHHNFHNHALGSHVLHGFQALALNETREAFSPVLWQVPPGHAGRVEQVWFRGSHGDIGGQIGDFTAARPLANIPLVWLLESLEEAADLPLPEGWKARFPRDASAPSVGNWGGWSKLFLSRRARIVGKSPSESIHPSAKDGGPDLPLAASVLGLAGHGDVSN